MAQATNLLRPSPGDTGGARIHRVDLAAIPVDGIQLERWHMLARRTDGRPVLWRHGGEYRYNATRHVAATRLFEVE